MLKDNRLVLMTQFHCSRMSTFSMPMYTLTNKLKEGVTAMLAEFLLEMEEVEKSYQAEIRLLRSQRNETRNPKTNVSTKAQKRSSTIVREQAPKQNIPVEPESGEPLVKLPKMEQTEHSELLNLESSEPLATKEEPNEVLQPSSDIPKQEHTEISVSSATSPLLFPDMPNMLDIKISEPYTIDPLPDIPKMLDIKVSEPYTAEPLADRPNMVPMEVSEPVVNVFEPESDIHDGSETPISELQGMPKGQQAQYDNNLATEQESGISNASTVAGLKSDSKEKDTVTRDITTSLQDMAFGNLNAATECPLPGSSKGILDKDLGSLEPPKPPHIKIGEDTQQKTILEFPRMRPYKPCGVITGSPDPRRFMMKLFQACKNLPEDRKPLIAKVVTKDDFELMHTALGNVPIGQSSRHDFTYHNDAPQYPQLPLNPCLKLVTTLPTVNARELKDVRVFMGINCDAPSNLDNTCKHKEKTEHLQNYHLSNNSFLSALNHEKHLTLKMVNQSSSHTSPQEEEQQSQALREYCCAMCVNWSPCGKVVHPNIPWLAALPHGMVYDPKEDPRFGLVHVSCSSHQSFMACPFLSFENGVVHLKKDAPHYWCIQGELMVTGLSWCDLVVVAKDDILVQRIYRDTGAIEAMKKKLDIFYIYYYLPSLK